MAVATHTIESARAPDDFAEFARLAREYAAELPFDLCFQNFEAELAALPGCYAEPRGAILLARPAGAASGAALGCVALRPLAPTTCEMKRLYLAPAGRGCGLGRRLVEAVLSAAIERGYETMRLDTVADMTAANALYVRLGFETTAPYYANPLPNVRYFSKRLR